jgi:uncharacterized protein (DUF4415 family)
MTEEEIARTSPPELADLPDDFWDDAEVITPPPKEAISLRVDRDVLAWFRAGGRGYQTRMNAVLRSYMQAKQGSSAAGSKRPRRKEKGSSPEGAS